MKKIIVLSILLTLITTGCSTKNQLKNYKKVTTCTSGPWKVEKNDEEFKDNIKEHSYRYKYWYNDLSDNDFFIESFSKYTFNDYEQAVSYYKKLKENNKDEITEIKIKENIDTNITTVTKRYSFKMNENVRKWIHKNQNASFECKTKKNRD